MRLPFPVRGDDLALRHAANEEALPLRIIRNPLRDKLRVFQPERDRRGGSLWLFVRELPSNLPELRLVPDRVEPRVAHGNEPQVATFQAAQQFHRRLAFPEADMNGRLVEDKDAITRPILP